MLPNPSPGVAQAIAAIDAFLAELRALRAQLAAARHPSRLAPVRRRARRTRRRILRQLARPGRN